MHGSRLHRLHELRDLRHYVDQSGWMQCSWHQLSSCVVLITAMLFCPVCRLQPLRHYTVFKTKLHARLAFGDPSDHITPALLQLHWLLIAFRIKLFLCFFPKIVNVAITVHQSSSPSSRQQSIPRGGCCSRLAAQISPFHGLAPNLRNCAFSVTGPMLLEQFPCITAIGYKHQVFQIKNLKNFLKPTNNDIVNAMLVFCLSGATWGWQNHAVLTWLTNESPPPLSVYAAGTNGCV